MGQNYQYGGCLCGQVRYSIREPRIYGVVCHCATCRRITGSTFVTASIYPKGAFKITSGSEIIKTFKSMATDSGTPLMRNFCSECGSQLFALTALNDQIISLCAGSLDRVGEWTPAKEQYCRNKAGWVAPLDAGSVQRHVAGPQSEAPKL